MKFEFLALSASFSAKNKAIVPSNRSLSLLSGNLIQLLLIPRPYLEAFMSLKVSSHEKRPEYDSKESVKFSVEARQKYSCFELPLVFNF